MTFEDHVKDAEKALKFTLAAHFDEQTAAATRLKTWVEGTATMLTMGIAFYLDALSERGTVTIKYDTAPSFLPKWKRLLFSWIPKFTYTTTYVVKSPKGE